LLRLVVLPQEAVRKAGAGSLLRRCMMAGKLSERLQEADWKTEKHVPVIEAPDQVPGSPSRSR